ncbi:penicillin-binding transpeptidase domain-containing protein [Neobacillus mesonae]|uniref:penicillin-binding transpeptidase domain-containing protein n=1 Tax=Neobacillus mesonae TaxID=1193713 RepID=UPI00203E330F|nr:penicillin-binding transpeptidase domain-containing protein [Neobacillus mesonae]MCM3569928.1 penicillin-binding transpeptidase domain-containing protein [Neobacillus mesonae]
MSNSVTWYFLELDKNTRRNSIQTYLNQISYGNTDLSGSITQYWLENSLKISPIEQVQLLIRMYLMLMKGGGRKWP